jgi:FdhD protein
MAPRRSERLLVQRYADGELHRSPDEVIVEEPLAIQLDGVLVATTMRTPGHDFELAVGYCHTEGLLGGARVQRCRFCGEGYGAAQSDFNVVDVDTGGHAPVPQPRLGPTTSACGLCGSATLADLQVRLAPLTGAMAIDPAVLVTVPDRVRVEQDLFGRTGGVHAAAAFDGRGEVLAVREDIGRHNAVDKVVGRMLLDGSRPPADGGLFVSGRASFEMVQKAWAGGFGTVISVSAPSALAVAVARAAGITLAGFVRGDRLNLYTGATG